MKWDHIYFAYTFYFLNKGKKGYKEMEGLTLDNKDKEKYLEERNDKTKAFKKNQEKQLERDQVVMPIDDLPIDEIKYEQQEERNKKETKHRSTSEKL
jgi:hypothetical protein